MGFPWRVFGKIAVAIGPAILEHYGVPAILIPLVIKSMGAAETAITSGTEKKVAVMDTTKRGIELSNQVGVPIDAGAVEAVGVGVDAVVRAVNAALK